MLLVWAMLACAPAPVGEAGTALTLPTGFPALAVPEDNPLTVEKVALGRHLFYDMRLSGNGEQACASCHEQALAFTDGREVAVGSTGQHHVRNSQSLTNVGYNATLTWANPNLVALETQILIPLFGEEPVELGADDASLARLNEDPLYAELMAQAFPEVDGPMDWDHAVKALASFNRALVSGGSRVDLVTTAEDSSALTASELEGMNLFFSERLECHHCHGGFNFSESSVHAGSSFETAKFHNTGLYNVDGLGGFPADNTGVFEVSGDPADMGRFRPPTLRNIAVTAPYMHDGSLASLDEVVRFYEAGGRLIEAGPNAGDGRDSPLKSPLVPGFTLSDLERQDLLAFLNALTDEDFLAAPHLSDPFAP